LLLKCLPELHRQPIELRLRDGHCIVVRSFMTLFIFAEIFIHRIYDAALRGAPRTILDIGANTGLFLLRAHQLCPDATIVAVEPEPANAAMLEETIRVNRLDGVRVVKAAITPLAGPVTLHLSPRNIGGHSTVMARGGQSIEVPGIPLAQALTLLPEGRCDLLKMDCEGAELGILAAMPPELAAKIGAMVYESERTMVAEATRLAAALGFSVEMIPSPADAEPTVFAARPQGLGQPRAPANIELPPARIVQGH
jgi:FkbM family methyltransferase